MFPTGRLFGIHLNKGQGLFSIQSIIDGVSWTERNVVKKPNKKTVLHILKWLEFQNMISRESNGNGTFITVCNWSRYQAETKAKVTESTPQGIPESTPQPTPTKEVKEVKEVKPKDITPPPERPDFIPPELWKPLLANRKFKKLQNTELALKVFCNAILVGIEKGYTAEECVGEFVSSSWKRFNVEWMNGKTKSQFESWDQPAQQEKPKTKRQLEALRLLETL